jgi:pyruvate decarboxylase
MFEKMSRHITAATIVLRDPVTATKDIDEALTTMVRESRPVYIGVPTDVALVQVSDDGLKTPIPRILPGNNPKIEKEIVSKIRSLIDGASKPVIVVDGGKPEIHRIRTLSIRSLITYRGCKI